MTKTAQELTYSFNFWKKRADEQKQYIEEVSQSNRSPERKKELIDSAQHIWARCIGLCVMIEVGKFIAKRF